MPYTLNGGLANERIVCRRCRTQAFPCRLFLRDFAIGISSMCTRLAGWVVASSGWGQTYTIRYLDCLGRIPTNSPVFLRLVGKAISQSHPSVLFQSVANLSFRFLVKFHK